MSLKSILFAALPLAACASDPITPESPDPAVELEGTTGTIPYKHAWGVQQEHYQVVDGEVIIRGDIIAGRADRLQARSIPLAGGRWPNNTVRFAFDAGYPAGTRQNFLDDVAAIEANSPINFIEIANPCEPNDEDCGTDYILLRIWDHGYGVSALGYQGGQQRIYAGVGFGGFQHELYHALGVYHEQERNDRDAYVRFRPECTIDSLEGNYAKNADASLSFGAYDFGSMMHYRSNPSSTLPEAERLAAPCNGNWPLTRIGGSCPPSRLDGVLVDVCTDRDGDSYREFIDPVTRTPTDIDVLWAMYGSPLGVNEAGDAFASVLAVGDFDGDERPDLAVGIPSEDTSVANAGAVMVYKGTADGFQPWKLVTQNSIGAIEEAGDNLGVSLAVGDFNDDGIDDLAMGASGESVGGNPDAAAGAVYLMKGTANGLVYWRSVTQENVTASVEGGDRFGQALTVGDFNGDGRDDLAVGSTGETHGDGIRAGHVYVLRGTGNNNALAAWTSVGQADLGIAPNVAPGSIGTGFLPLGTNQSGDSFGSALAVGRVDDDNLDDLVVAANCDDEVASCAGGVYLYRGSASGMRGWMRVAQSTGSDTNDRFGWAVATGDVDMDGDDDVIIGAPYDDYSGAADVGRVYIARPNGHVIASVTTMTQASGDAGTNDHFGSSIAFGNNGVFDVLAIGARDEAWGAGAAAGAMFTYTASDSGNPTFDDILRASPASDELAEDQFGASVAVYTHENRDILIVGNPGEDSNTGNVQVFRSSTVGATLTQSQLVVQTTKGTRAP